MRTPLLIPISLKEAKEHECPEIKEGVLYLAYVEDEFRVGTFVREWFGWSFACDFGVSGHLQFDAPGWNSSGWKGLWRIVKR